MMRIQSPQLQSRPIPVVAQGSEQERVTRADRIRDAIAARHNEWDARRPNVLDLTADALAALHGRINGRTTELADLRSAKYLREAIRGEKPMTLEDVALIALDEPEAGAALLDVLARAAGYRLQSEGQEVSELLDIGARLAHASGVSLQTLMEIYMDGYVDAGECDRVIANMDNVSELAAQMKRAALHRKARLKTESLR